MSNQKEKTRSSLATEERAANKQSNLTTYAAAVAVALAIYAFMTFGLGHIFGVI